VVRRSPTQPMKQAEHRAWWQDNTTVPYGFCWCGCGNPTSLAERNDSKRGLVKGHPKRYLAGHSGGRGGAPMTDAEHRAWWAERTNAPYGLCRCGCGERTPIATYTNRDKGYARGRPTALLRGHANRLKHQLEAETLTEPNPSGLCMCGCGQRTPLARQTSTSQGWVRSKPLPFLPNHFSHKLTPEQETDACRRYADGETCNEIGASFGVSHKTVARALERHGIARNVSTRSWTEERRQAYRRHDCDHSFFDSIDTEAKAYWLGFLAADGCNTNGFMSVSLSSRDRDHLYRFRQDLGSTHPISERTDNRSNSFGSAGRKTSTLAIRSPKLTEGLAAHGIIPRKTFVLRWPDFLSPDLLRHYLRGYTDGDGYFGARPSSYVRKRDGQRGVSLYWGIIGNEGFCRGAQEYLMDAVSVGQTKLRPSPNAVNEGIMHLSYGGNKQVSRIWHLLYNSASVYLPRKRAVAELYVA
jgi:hypothetical protein